MTLELLTRLQGNDDFQQYQRHLGAIVAQARSHLHSNSLPDAELPKAKAAFLAVLEIFNLPIGQEITCRALLNPTDPRIVELAGLKLF